MTLLSVVKDVCAVVGVTVPQSVFSNITGNRTMQEMLALANEMAQRIAFDTRDWTLLSAEGQITDTMADPGGGGYYFLPANFKRMLLTGNMWRSTSIQTPMLFVPDMDEWLQRRASNATHASGEWQMAGKWLRLHPLLAPGETVRFNYIITNCIQIHGSITSWGDEFQNDDDKFGVDERLLKLGMIWQWKAQKGASYAEDMGTYGDALAVAMGHDRPAPIIIGRKLISATAAYPWPVPT